MFRNKFYLIWIAAIIILTMSLIKFGRADTADHLVISEIQVAGQTANDEFIELYNPTLSTVDLSSWSIQYRGGSAGSFSRKNFVSGSIISPHGFFLIAHNDFAGSVTPDMRHSSFAMSTSGGTVFLVNNQTTLSVGNESSIIDKVAYGTGTLLPELNGPAFTPSPPANQSIERRPGGDQGNGEDTNDNSQDFFATPSPNPQNTSSSPEPAISGPVCGNSTCETGEDYNNCPADCPNNNNDSNRDQQEIYVPHQIQPGDILINEIFPEPDATKGESEWIEFYNYTADAAIDLTGWTLEDNTAKPITLAGIVLAPRQYYVLPKNKFSFALNNGGDTLILKDNQAIIDQVAYGDYEDGNVDDNAPAPGKSKSIGRNNNVEPMDTNNDKNDFSICQSVTPGRANDVALTDSSRSTVINSVNVPVIISEFLPNPVGSDSNEWIELYNSGFSAVDLTGWQIDDGEGGSNPYTLPSGTIITAGGYLVLPRSQTKIVLNNDFDAVRLLRTDKTIQEQINYKDPPEGASYARDNSGNWQYTASLTPGSANIFNTDDTSSQSADTTDTVQNPSTTNSANLDLASVDDLPQLDNGQAATLQGLVVASPGLFAKSYFYINGAQIYSSAAKFPDLQIGDLVEVKGTVSSSFSNRRLKIKSADDIQILSHQDLVPQTVIIGDLDDGLIGHFLQISGQLVDKTGSKLQLDDDQDELEVYLSPAIKWNKKILTEGQNLQVSGILEETNSGWRLLPRCDNDLIVSAVTIDSALVGSQNSTSTANQIKPTTTNLLSSTATVWQNLIHRSALKYLFLSAGIIIIFLVGVFLKLRGII